MPDFVTPEFFDILIIINIVIGLIWAGFRLYGDFKGYPERERSQMVNEDTQHITPVE